MRRKKRRSSPISFRQLIGVPHHFDTGAATLRVPHFWRFSLAQISPVSAPVRTKFCRTLCQSATKTSTSRRQFASHRVKAYHHHCCPSPDEYNIPRSSTMPSPDIHTANISRRRSPISPINPSSRTQSRPSSSNSDQLSDNSTACLEICQYGTEGVGGVPAGWLDHHFSSLPGLHDSIGKDIPGVQWRKSDIYLRNDYRTSLYRPSKQFQHVDTLTPDPAKAIRERQRTG